jgi:hypothetical protein
VLAEVAPVMGVAGGELLPTIVLLYRVDIKIAGSLSLVVLLPTMLVACAHYGRDNCFQAAIRGSGVAGGGSVHVRASTGDLVALLDRVVMGSDVPVNADPDTASRRST